MAWTPADEEPRPHAVLGNLRRRAAGEPDGLEGGEGAGASDPTATAGA